MTFSAISYFMANPQVYMLEGTWTEQVTSASGLTELQMMVTMHMITVPLVFILAYYLIFIKNGKRPTARWVARKDCRRSCSFYSMWWMGGTDGGEVRWNLRILLSLYSMWKIGILFVGSELNINFGNLEEKILLSTRKRIENIFWWWFFYIWRWTEGSNKLSLVKTCLRSFWCWRDKSI